MAELSANVVLTGDPDDWIAVAWDAETHAFGGEAPILNGSFSITGLTAGRAYMVACRPKTGGIWRALSSDFAVGSYVIPTNPINTPYIFKATAAAARGDPQFSSVKMLLHFEGSNNSTSFVDVKGNTLTVSSGPKISTAQAKFGTASGLFSAAGYITVSDSSVFDIASGQDFTMEAWVRPADYQNFIRTFLSWFDGIYQIQMAITTGGKLYCRLRDANLTGATTMSLNTWHHVALCRSSGTVKMYLNGNSEGTPATVSQAFLPTSMRLGGQYDGTGAYNGYIDDLRVTIGHCRYTANFTPPIAAFADESGQVTSATEPQWNTTPGSITQDDAITWTNMGRMVRPLINGPAVAA